MVMVPKDRLHQGAAVAVVYDTLEKLDRRREELLQRACQPSETDDELITEWMMILHERDEVTRETIEQENKNQLAGLLSELHQVICSIGEFAECLPDFLHNNISVLYKNLSQHISDTREQASNCQIKTMTNKQNESNNDDDKQQPPSDLMPNINQPGSFGKQSGEPKWMESSAVENDKYPPLETTSNQPRDTERSTFSDSSVYNTACLTGRSLDGYGAPVLSATTDPTAVGGVLGAAGEDDCTSVYDHDDAVPSCTSSTGTADTSSLLSLTPSTLDLSPGENEESPLFRTSTPHHPRSSRKHSERAPGAREKKRRNGDKRSKKIRMRHEAGATVTADASSYRPRLWNIVSNVISWYSKPQVELHMKG